MNRKEKDRKRGREVETRSRLDWKQASDYWTKGSPMARGNRFNQTTRDSAIYPYHEVHLKSGRRLDSYDPLTGEIISRKATDLDNITEKTYRGYLSEFKTKYSVDTEIRSNAHPNLDGKTLQGDYILEIPTSNLKSKNLDYYKEIAAEYGVTLRFLGE